MAFFWLSYSSPLLQVGLQSPNSKGHPDGVVSLSVSGWTSFSQRYGPHSVLAHQTGGATCIHHCDREQEAGRPLTPPWEGRKRKTVARRRALATPNNGALSSASQNTSCSAQASASRRPPEKNPTIAVGGCGAHRALAGRETTAVRKRRRPGDIPALEIQVPAM
ncbi:hypothetical protein F5148DRAFT_1147173 [Russula earlei]|uniref:Uncharacterized protein n=1 Tax=Russula earlei TaxID=71964 RepID=A0ACC0UH53_9AGAM|nr:hypothetical protein F5148DRAFT_1147173 [Russula earlei]